MPRPTDPPSTTVGPTASLQKQKDIRPKVFDHSPNILGLSSKMPREVVVFGTHGPTSQKRGNRASAKLFRKGKEAFEVSPQDPRHKPSATLNYAAS
jgi:hypothetical protein